MVVNQGNAPAGAFRVSWDFGSGSGGQNVPGLGANQSYPLEWDSLPLYASYNSVAMADESQVVQESNEGNNRLVRWVSVELPTVDLQFAWLAIRDRTFWGQQIDVQIGVENSGNGPAGPFVVRCVVCSQECSWVVDGLGPGEEQSPPSCSAIIYPPCDWQCVIDPANSVLESNEDNNSWDQHIDLIS
jgi:subtilase family serine protease